MREEDCGAEEEVEGFQKEAEVQHEGVDDRSLDRGPAEVVRLEDGVAGKGEAEEEERGDGTGDRHCFRHSSFWLDAEKIYDNNSVNMKGFFATCFK